MSGVRGRGSGRDLRDLSSYIFKTPNNDSIFFEWRRTGFDATMRTIHREDALSQEEEQSLLLPLSSPQHGCYAIAHYASCCHPSRLYGQQALLFVSVAEDSRHSSRDRSARSPFV